MAPTVEDSIDARGQPAGLLKAAVDTISENQVLTFVPYVRLVMPYDGYVFWLKATDIGESALLNAMGLNTTQLNSSEITSAIMPSTVQGSIHYAVDMRQEETANLAINRIAFTSQDHIQAFNTVGPNLIYIARFRGTRFAFSSKGMFYEQMKLWHYEGDAIYSTMESQIIDEPSLFNANRVIVSNSLPAWLTLTYYNPLYPVEVPMPRVTLYPSFLALQNVRPPYGVIHIGANDTSADQAVPDFDSRLTNRQLSRDRVRVTLYGLDDNTVQDWFMATLGYLRDAGVMGLTNVPNIRDDKTTQRELFVIAQKKQIDFEVSYIQERVRDTARQMIETVIPPATTIQTAIPPSIGA